MTIPEMILSVLSSSSSPLCNGEIAEAILNRYGVKVQDATISARERDVLRGKVECVRADGKPYKLWRVVKMGQMEIAI